MPAPNRPAIIVISSHVARGGVGLRAAGFALERLGFPVWSVPTVLLPYHPGHGRSTRIVPADAEFAASLADLAASRWLGEVGAVLSGYLGDAAQAEPIADLVGAVRAANPQAVYCCDPVIGDEAGLYVDAATAAAVRDRLVPLADIVTPNRFELAWLAGTGTDDNARIIAAAERLARPQALISSAHAMVRGGTAVLLAGNGAAPLLAEHRAIAGAPHGPGDLLAALFVAGRLSGLGDEENLRRATAATFEMIARSVAAGSDELALAAEQATIAGPTAMVTVRRLARAGAGHDRK